MQALYALPDHEVVTDLIPAVTETHLGHFEALEHIQHHRGIVPVAIDPANGGKVLWADLGDHPFREWQYMYTVQTLANDDAIAGAFTTDFDILADNAVVNDAAPPAGFIFHISRCGSTLLAKALARSDANVVINQGGPLQRGFWATITDNWAKPADPSPENLAMFRNLVLAMARRRADGQERSFIKFISWNSLYMEFARAAFPGLPSLFLYRDPVEVIASVFKETTAALWAKGRVQAGFLTGGDHMATRDMSDAAYLSKCFAEYFRVALSAEQDGLKHINYLNINAENFPKIIGEGLHFTPDAAELALMAEQFQYHSKDDSDKTQFRPDGAEKRAAMPDADKQMIAEECGSLVAQLDAAPNNLFRSA